MAAFDTAHNILKQYVNANKQAFATALSSRKILAIGIFICGIFIAVFGMGQWHHLILLPLPVVN